MLSAVIVGDDEEFLARFVEVVQEASSALEVNLQVVPFSQPDRLLRENGDFDVYFFDAEMESVQGLELAQSLRDVYISSEFVFVGRYEQYIRSLLRVRPVGFIRKSNLQEDIEETIKVLRKMLAEKASVVLLENNSRQEQVDLAEIVYIQSKEHYVYLYDRGGQAKIMRSKLGEVENRIQNCHFVRIHHSYMINLHWLAELCGNKVVMKTDVSIPISAKYREQAKPILKNWLEVR